MLVAGGGPAGVELAANLARLDRTHSLGLRVTVVDQGERLLARMPERAARIATQVLADQGDWDLAAGTSARVVGAADPALYTAADFSARLQGDTAFINRVMQQPKIWLIGQEEPAPHEPDQPA